MNDKEVFELRSLRERLFALLSQAPANALSMDDEEDREVMADYLADKIYSAPQRETEFPQNFIPRGNFRSGLHILDETTKEHIVTLVLDRERSMTNQDWLQLQNFMWAVIGRTIRADYDLQKTLLAGGVQVILDQGSEPGGGMMMA
jgi:hypothetical protein